MADIMAGKEVSVLEFRCPRCMTGVQVLWLTPDVMGQAGYPNVWVYRCDRCGDMLSPGKEMFKTDGTDELARRVRLVRMARLKTGSQDGRFPYGCKGDIMGMKRGVKILSGTEIFE